MIKQEITPERVLFRTQARALAMVLGKKKAIAFMKAMAADLQNSAESADIIPIRLGGEGQAKRKEAIVAAKGMFLEDLPSILAGIG